MIDPNELIRQAIEDMERTKHDLRFGTIWSGRNYGIYLYFASADGRLVGTIQPTLGM